MIPIQKTTSAIAEESLCGHSEGTGTVTGYTIASSCENGDINTEFIQVEELAVRRARRFVGVGFVFIAVAVSIAVFYFAKKSDDLAFEVEVRKNATTTFYSLRIEMKRMATKLIHDTIMLHFFP
jgi:hypothetical protein